MEITEKQRRQISTWLGSGSLNFFGLPYAGKDSQATIMVELFGGNVFGAGDILRNSIIPDRVKQVLSNGGIVPSADFVDIVLPYLSRQQFVDQPFMLTGLGRWHGEEEGVMKALKEANHELKYVIYINLPEEQVRIRWEKHKEVQDRGFRPDDDSETVLETRFREFKEKTLPVIEFYRDKGMLIEINGNQLREEVTKDILTQLLAKIS